MINRYLVELFSKIELLLAIFTGIFMLLVIPTAVQYGTDRVPAWVIFVGFALIEFYLIFPGESAMKQQEAKLFTVKWIKHMLAKTKKFTLLMMLYSVAMACIMHTIPSESFDKELYWFFSEKSFLIWAIVSGIGLTLLPSNKTIKKMLSEYYNKH